MKFTYTALLKTLVLIIPMLAYASDGSAPNVCEDMAGTLRRDLALERAYAVRPQRRDTPLRYLNISDDEVREVRLAASEMFGDVTLNISGVVTGCPCEDGPDCTDQVWVLADEANKTVGLQLSKIRGHWTIGTVQRWWIGYEALRVRERTAASRVAYADVEAAIARHIDGFPTCGIDAKELREGLDTLFRSCHAN